MNPSVSWMSKVEAYMVFRRNLGFKLTIDGTQLKAFARYADEKGEQERLTVALAMQWARASKRPSPITWARRIEVIRGFARFCLRSDPATEIPPRELFGSAHRRLVPHIYSDDELVDLLNATDHLTPCDGLRPATCRTVFGLLAASGLRISEAINLTRADVDLDAGVLCIQEAKFHKRRIVPLHPTTVECLKEYATLRDQRITLPVNDHFFLRDDGQPANQRGILYALHTLCRQLGWQPRSDHAHHRLHDLRHTFIVRSILCFYEQNIDVDQAILALSTYVGHARVSDTYWYCTGIPELMDIAAERFHRYAQGVPQ